MRLAVLIFASVLDVVALVALIVLAPDSIVVVPVAIANVLILLSQIRFPQPYWLGCAVCGRRRPPQFGGAPMCREHWLALPLDLRRDLLAAHREATANVHPPPGAVEHWDTLRRRAVRSARYG